MITQQLTDDIKAAMLARDSLRVETLRGIKSVILYAEVAAKKREEGLTDNEILSLMAKESKKRQESADLYVKGGSQERADKELAEKAIIDAYLPAQLDEDAIATEVADAIATLGATSLQQIGQVMGVVKQKLGQSADGAVVAKIVKQQLEARSKEA